MSRENLELALLMYEVFNRRDVDGMLELMHEEVEIEPRLGAMEGDYRGHEGVRGWWSNLLDFLPDDNAEVQALQDLGDMTPGQIRGRGHGAASGTPRRRDVVAFDQVGDGRCIWWRNLATEAEALETIGLEAG